MVMGEDEQITITANAEFEDDESMSAITLSTLSYMVLDFLQDEINGIPAPEELH
jgi:hypothetical protein